MPAQPSGPPSSPASVALPGPQQRQHQMDGSRQPASPPRLPVTASPAVPVARQREWLRRQVHSALEQTESRADMSAFGACAATRYDANNFTPEARSAATHTYAAGECTLPSPLREIGLSPPTLPSALLPRPSEFVTPSAQRQLELPMSGACDVPRSELSEHFAAAWGSRPTQGALARARAYRDAARGMTPNPSTGRDVSPPRTSPPGSASPLAPRSRPAAVSTVGTPRRPEGQQQDAGLVQTRVGQRNQKEGTVFV